ncbi:hypothetical protein Q2941_44550 [Bradyrhizobium sp. UFLA05-153]
MPRAFRPLSKPPAQVAISGRTDVLREVCQATTFLAFTKPRFILHELCLVSRLEQKSQLFWMTLNKMNGS